MHSQKSFAGGLVACQPNSRRFCYQRGIGSADELPGLVFGLRVVAHRRGKSTIEKWPASNDGPYC